MKKLTALLAATLMVTCAFTSCGSKEESSESSEASKKSDSSVSDESTEKDEKDDKKDDESSDAEEKNSDDEKSDEKKSDDKKSDDKKSDDEKSDEKKSEKKSGDSDSSSIVGKWYISEETLATMGDMDGMKIEKDSFIDFTEDNKLNITYILDCDSLFAVKDDKMSLYGTDVDYEFDGKTITIKEGENVMTFERVDASDKDNVYGQYTCPMLFDAASIPGVDDIKINFVKSGESSMEFIATGEYEFNADDMTVSFKSESFGNDTSSVEIDGDTLTVTDSSGTVEKYTRAND